MISNYNNLNCFYKILPDSIYHKNTKEANIKAVTHMELVKKIKW